MMLAQCPICSLAVVLLLSNAEKSPACCPCAGSRDQPGEYSTMAAASCGNLSRIAQTRHSPVTVIHPSHRFQNSPCTQGGDGFLKSFRRTSFLWKGSTQLQDEHVTFKYSAPAATALHNRWFLTFTGCCGRHKTVFCLSGTFWKAGEQ